MAKTFTKLISALVIALFCACGFAVAPIYAEDNDAANADGSATPAVWLQISPVSNRITLEPNQVYDGEFTVENIGSEAFSYKVYATPYYVSNDSYDLNFSTENSFTQIARWITFKDANGNYVDNATFSVNVGEKKTVNYRVTVPADVPGGGQYATLFAESIDNNKESSNGIKTVSRVGLVLFANTAGDTKQEASISDYNFTKFKFSGDLTAGAKISNTGNTDFTATYTYTVKSLFGKEIFSENNSYSILPETERRVSVEWADTPFMGVFQVNYKVSAAGVVEDHSSIVLVMPIFVLIIAILLLTFIIIWIIFLIRKRKERKSRLLV